MCVDAVESKYQPLNNYKLLFDSVVHQQQQYLHCFWQHSSSFVTFERNFTTRIFSFVTQTLSARNFHFETEGVER
jgi:hypothetical protein